MKPDQAEEIVRDLYEDRRDKLGYDEIRHIEAVVGGTKDILAQQERPVDIIDSGVVVAWLHDTVEDNLLSFRELYHDLNREQFEALLLLTRDGRQTYMNYIRMLRDASGLAGIIAKAVKLADLDHNMSRPCPEHMQGMREPGGRYDRAQKLLKGRGA